MTFREYCYQLENYQYSKEHFEIMKEAHELELELAYIDGQEFLVENADMIDDLGFFQEAAAVDAVENVKKDTEDKSEGLFWKLLKRIRRWFDGLISFFKSLIDKAEKFFTGEEDEETEFEIVSDEEVSNSFPKSDPKPKRKSKSDKDDDESTDEESSSRYSKTFRTADQSYHKQRKAEKEKNSQESEDGGTPRISSSSYGMKFDSKKKSSKDDDDVIYGSDTRTGQAALPDKHIIYGTDTQAGKRKVKVKSGKKRVVAIKSTDVPKITAKIEKEINSACKKNHIGDDFDFDYNQEFTHVNQYIKSIFHLIERSGFDHSRCKRLKVQCYAALVDDKISIEKTKKNMDTVLFTSNFDYKKYISALNNLKSKKPLKGGGTKAQNRNILQGFVNLKGGKETYQISVTGSDPNDVLRELTSVQKWINQTEKELKEHTIHANPKNVLAIQEATSKIGVSCALTIRIYSNLLNYRMQVWNKLKTIGHQSFLNADAS